VLADRYRLIARLGRGGFGEVWRAEDSRLGREVAVKTLTLPVTDEAQKRFAREGRALARLDHPNVVAVYDCGVDDGTGYLVMQLLSGCRSTRRSTWPSRRRRGWPARIGPGSSIAT
jgi:serine/threonine protein kinase